MVYKASEFLKVIPGTGGIYSRIADRLGCDWHTVKRGIERYVTVAEAIEAERARVTDKSEGNVVDSIFGYATIPRSVLGDPEFDKNYVVVEDNPGDPGVKIFVGPNLGDSKWYLSRIARDRFSTRAEVTGKDGEAIEHKLGLTDSERWERFEDLLKG